MTKKNQKIINGILDKEKKNFSKVAFDTDTGFYYATDGFRMVRIEVSEMCNAEIPLFTDKDKVVLPNYKRNYQTANEIEYTKVLIPYTIAQIKKWKSANIKADRKVPFTFGMKINYPYRSNRKGWFGINPKYLIEAMETTGSQYIYVPNEGYQFFMEGNGYTWLICAVECKDDSEFNKHMTEIPEMENVEQKA